MLVDLAFINRSLENTFRVWKDSYNNIKANKGNTYEFLDWIEYLYGDKAASQFRIYLIDNGII